MRTYNDVYLDARRRLKAAGVEDYSMEARLLMQKASGKTKEELLRDMKLYATGDFEPCFEALLSRRAAGEPVAYVLGEWEFMGLPFNVSPAVLIPRADTELLAELAIKLVRSRVEGSMRVLDLCCGTGCIGIAIAKLAASSRVVMVDNSQSVLRVARANVARNSVARNAVCVEADAMAQPPMLLGKFDIIVSNPPYVPTAEIDTLEASVRDYEPRAALDGGDDGLIFYREIIPRWKVLLKERGCMLFECGEGQAEEIEELLKKEGFERTASYRDGAGTKRVVAGIL